MTRSPPSRPVTVALLALGLLLGPMHGSAQPQLEVDIREDGVYMRVQERSLADALEALAAAAGFELKTNDAFTDPVSMRVEGVPLPTAIRRLVRNHSSVMMYGKNESGERKIRELRVYRASQGQPQAPILRAGNGLPPGLPAGLPPGLGAGLPQEALDPGRMAELATLLDPNSNTREQRQAITELRGVGGDMAVQALSTALQLPDKTVRSYAVAVLGQIGSPQAVEILGQAATTDEEADVRIRAVIALARQHGDQARNLVQGVAARDADERVREAAQARLNAW